jgi:ubiquinone/menaquinone biosynthesis C-methylase UbiE
MPDSPESARSYGNLAVSTDWTRCDEIMARYLEGHEDLEDRWLFHQTILTAASRRSLLGILRPQPGWRTLDLGCGFGPIPLEMAGMLPVRAIGVDSDPDKISVSSELSRQLSDANWFHPASSVDFRTGDVYALEHPAEEFDFVSARFLFQHLTNPRAVVSEIGRVIKPGGTVCIVDVDDALSVTYPELPDEFRAIVQALYEVQSCNGGDRSVGRKIASYLDEDGFVVTNVLVLAEAFFGSPLNHFAARRYLIDRITAIREQITEYKILTDEECDKSMTAIPNTTLSNHFMLGGHLAVLATRSA